MEEIQNNKSSLKRAQQRYRHTEHGRKLCNEMSLRYVRNNREKVYARNTANRQKIVRMKQLPFYDVIIEL